MPQPSAAPPSAAGKRGLPLAFWPLALTYLAVAMNMTVASVALPTLSTDLQATASQLVWVVNITALASAALILFAGSWGDRFGRKRLLQIGIVVFLVAAVLSALSTSIVQLIILRGLTGVGSALTMPAALALAFHVVPEASRRTAVGIISAMQAVGSLLGPAVGGLLLTYFWWGSAFLSVTPLLLASVLLAHFYIPKDTPLPSATREPMDTWGATLMAVAAVGLLYGAVTASAGGDDQDVVAAVSAGIGVLAVVALVWWERRCPNPIFVWASVRTRAFWVPTLTILLVQFVLGGIMFANTQYVQLALGFSPFAAGAFLLPALGAWIVVSATAGLTARRLGSRLVAALGLGAATIGLLLVSTSSLDPMYVVLVVGLVLVGCMGVAPALMTHLAVDSYPESRRTIGSAINSVAMRFGLAFGVAAFGTVMAARYATSLAPSLGGLSSSQADLADNSLGGAIRVSQEVGGSTGEALVSAARDSFMSGFQLALVGAALVLALVTVLVAVAAPRAPSVPADEVLEDVGLPESEDSQPRTEPGGAP